jgi:hypothetical protein
MTIDPALLGWCAGLLDGEGSIGIYGGNVQVRIVMTHEATIRRVHEVLGVGRIRRWRPRGIRRAAWRWYAGGSRSAHAVLTALRPLLVTKAAEADLALRFLRDQGLSAGDRKDLARAVAAEKHGCAESADAVKTLLSRPTAQLDFA